MLSSTWLSSSQADSQPSPAANCCCLQKSFTTFLHPNNFYSHNFSIAHRTPILIFIFCSVFYRHSNWQYRAARSNLPETNLSEIFFVHIDICRLLINFLNVARPFRCYNFFSRDFGCKVRANRGRELMNILCQWVEKFQWSRIISKGE